jgi:SAM-dependent methyltransferase
MVYTAYGVEPNRRATYELRQARYMALGKDVADEAARLYAMHGRRCRLLDIGTYDGVARRYIEAHPGWQYIDFSAVDIFPHGKEFVYKHASWKLHNLNLLEGMPRLPSDFFDVVICEQVLEHLTDVRPAVRDMVRVLKPAGLLVVGVPIFPEGMHLVRRHLVPVTDRLFGVKKVRGHVQAWSLRTFLRDLQRDTAVSIQQRRGFRIVSGGILRPLEFTRWWWKLNLAVGSIVPGLCTEVQIVCRKPASEVALPADASGPQTLPQSRTIPLRKCA